MDLLGRKRCRRQRQCRHLHALGIYGDAILMTGKRGFCRDCGLWLDALPYRVEITDRTPPPAYPGDGGRVVVDPIWTHFFPEDGEA